MAKQENVTLTLTPDQMADLWRIVDHATTGEYGREVDLKQAGKLKAAAATKRIGDRYLSILDIIEAQAGDDIKKALGR